VQEQPPRWRAFGVFFSAAVIALIVSATSSLHLPVLHLGTAGMGIAAGIIYLGTLLGADSSEFTKNHKKSSDANSNQSERKPLIDINETAQINKYGIDIHQRGNITVDSDSDQSETTPMINID